MTDGLGSTVLNRLQQFLCGLQGHDELRQFERNRLCLKCTSCGHESPGWELERGMARSERRRQSIRHHLVGVRRVA